MSSTVYPLSPSVITAYGTPDTFATAYAGVIDGDDLSANAGTWAQQLFALNGGVPSRTWAQMEFGTNANIQCVAVAGQTVATMNTNAAANVDALIVGGKTNFVIVQGGNADAVAGASAATIASRLATYCTARKTAGWNKVVLVGLLQSSGNAAVYATLNATLKANFLTYGADAYADVAGHVILGAAAQYSNRQYFLTDSLTLTPNGTIIYVDVVIGAVKSALGL